MDGQLGDGTTVERHAPVQVIGLGHAVSVAGGYNYTLAARSDGSVWTWGIDDGNLLGVRATTTCGPFACVPAPAQVVGPGGGGFLSGAVAVAAGTTQRMALKADGTVWAWGNNQYGQLGDGTATQRLTPVQVVGPGGAGYLTNITAIAAGEDFSLALKANGTVWAWGDNGVVDTLGNGSGYCPSPSLLSCSSTPVQVLDGTRYGQYLTGVVAISANTFGEHSLALKADGTVWAWGADYQGELGNGRTDTGDLATPVLAPDGVSPLSGVVAIAAGDYYSLALKADGTVVGWGTNRTSVLGTATFPLCGVWAWPCTSLPVQIPGLQGVRAIASGAGHALALADDGSVWSWGSNWAGQLGDGTTIDRSTPVQVIGPGGVGHLTEVKQLFAGAFHSLVIADPLPAATLDSAGLSFGSQPLYAMSSGQTLTVTNTGGGNLTVGAVALQGANAADFAFTSDTCSFATLSTGTSCTVVVAFTPSAIGSRSAILSFPDNAADSPQVVTLSGVGVAALATTSASTIPFSDQVYHTTSATQTVTVTDTGNLPLDVGTVSVDGADATDFSVTADTCSGTTIVAGDSCTITVAFTPGGFNTRAATLAIPSNAVNGTQTIMLMGVGVYSWSDVLRPLNAAGTNSFNLDRTVPVQFQLTGTCASITNAPATLSLAPVVNGVVGEYAPAVSTSGASIGDAFRYDPESQQYIFNLSTKGLSAGTYRLLIDLGDGVPHTVDIVLA